MNTISKSVLQITGQVIHEDDKDEFFDLLNQAADHIHWELESGSYDFAGFSYKKVLRYVPERKMWAHYLINGDTGEDLTAPINWKYYKKYENALRTFNHWCDDYGLYKSKTRRTKPVFNTE